MTTTTVKAPKSKSLNPVIEKNGKNVKVTPETKARVEKSKEKPAKKALVVEAQLGEYNGKPTLSFTPEGSSFGLTFGLGKARMLVADPDWVAKISAFVASEGQSIDI